MKLSGIISSLSLLFLFSTAVLAGQTSCPEHFFSGQPPDFINHKLTARTQEVCYSGYALNHSGVTRTPLYAAEHLTRARLIQAKGMKRDSTFFPDPNIPVSDRAELDHYKRSGFDRGHVAPSADMPDAQSQQECFSLANMVPQEPSINRGIWGGVESAVRNLTKDRGELYVVTGPIFSGSSLQRIGGAVMVPTQMFKAVYDPQQQEAGAYLAGNTVGAQVQEISIAELEKLTGINLFPAVSVQVKAQGMNLPDPQSYKDRKRKGVYK